MNIFQIHQIIWKLYGFHFVRLWVFFWAVKVENTRCIVAYIMCVFKTSNMVFLIWLWKQVFIFASVCTVLLLFYSSISSDFCQHLYVEYITILIKFKWKTVKIFLNIYKLALFAMSFILNIVNTFFFLFLLHFYVQCFIIIRRNGRVEVKKLANSC